MRLCCNANSYTETKGILRKSDGTPYNAGRDDWNEARNSQMLKDVRVAMMKGEWHSECERCKQEEEAGQNSRRMFDTLTAQNLAGVSMEECLSNTKSDGTLDTSQEIEFMDIRYGNFCNLKCRMCGPTDSHTWYEDFLAVHDTTFFEDTHGIVNLQKNDKGRLYTTDYDWFKDSTEYVDNFSKYTNSVKKIYVVGGEPLIIQEHTDTLRKLIETGASKNTYLEYNTNLTTVSDEIMELWKNFKKVGIGASIDGFGEVFEYQRMPANWNSVYRNMKKINDTSEIDFKAWISFTVTNINIFHLPEFMKWKLESSELDRFNQADSHKPIISFHMCHGPKRYNIRALPPAMKLEVSGLFNEYREWIEHTHFDDHIKYHFELVLNTVEDFMYKQDLSEHFTGKKGFIEMTKKLDQIRNQNILDIVPQYKSYFQ